ncbi:ribonuclease Z [Sphingobacterium humi]|uniref:Ribonuclease Z n=1 Tax=Sphingobacterium humi TaxID=1796905 RepID=A0A6N8KW74_9SPHI|nr:ribonuclease Z [Sphingobacterium humi]
MRFEVFILGNSSATPIYERHPTSQVVNYNEQLFLIDCGEGTQMQLSRYGIKSNRIGHVFISHLHGDHYLGLIGLLSSMHLVGRKSDLHLYGPAPLEEILELHFKHSETQIRYKIIFHPTNALQEEVIYESRMLQVTSFPLVHRIPCTGFRFQEGKRNATLIPERLEALNIPKPYFSAIKRGIDYVDAEGNLIPAAELTYPAPASRAYAYCSDTVRSPIYLKAIEGVDLLYHESTFLHEMLDRAKETFHTTCLEAAEIAREVQAKKLLLGHYSARYKILSPLLEEAQAIFPDTALSVEGKWFLV